MQWIVRSALKKAQMHDLMSLESNNAGRYGCPFQVCCNEVPGAVIFTEIIKDLSGFENKQLSEQTLHPARNEGLWNTRSCYIIIKFTTSLAKIKYKTTTIRATRLATVFRSVWETSSISWNVVTLCNDSSNLFRSGYSRGLTRIDWAFNCLMNTTRCVTIACRLHKSLRGFFPLDIIFEKKIVAALPLIARPTPRNDCGNEKCPLRFFFTQINFFSATCVATKLRDKLYETFPSVTQP